MREGNLEAPTRHPLDWQNPEFYDEASALKEMERVFDICHGCRRCVSLCQSFPTLFDLVDETDDGEVHGIRKEAYWSVVDQCYLCDLCYMTKCPYTPPHEWNLDFPHLMLRAKAIKYKKGEVKARREVPGLDRRARQLRRHPGGGADGQRRQQDQVRAQADGQHARRAPRRLDARAGHEALPLERGQKSPSTVVTNGERTPGKVAIFSTCYVNYNEPGIGHDLLKVLAHNDIPYVIVDKEKCCGMPKLELGDLDAVAKHKAANIPVLARYAREGYAIVSADPELHADVQAGTAADVPRLRRHAGGQGGDVRPLRVPDRAPPDGLLKTDFKTALGKVSYHIPCHGRVQNIGKKTEEMFKLIGQHGRGQAEHGRALFRPRRHLWREDAVPPGGDEDRPAGVQGHGQGRARLHQQRLRARRPPHRPGHGARPARPPRRCSIP